MRHLYTPPPSPARCLYRLSTYLVRARVRVNVRYDRDEVTEYDTVYTATQHHAHDRHEPLEGEGG